MHALVIVTITSTGQAAGEKLQSMITRRLLKSVMLRIVVLVRQEDGKVQAET